MNSLSAALELNAIILQDSKGQVLVITSTESLLDIAVLNNKLNRELKPCSANHIQSLFQKHQLDSSPCIPGILPLFTIADEKIFKAKEVIVATGHDKQSLCYSSEDFKNLCSKVRLMSVTIGFDKLQSTNLDHATDLTEITAAVANFTQLRIKQRLEETFEFPPLPSTAQQIIKLRANPHADIKDLTDIVEADPSLAAQVVSWASSPYYAAPGNIKSVHDSIVRVLGFDLVLNLALGLALGKTLNIPNDAARGFSPYWQQAVYTATAVAALAALIAPQDRPAMGVTSVT